MTFKARRLPPCQETLGAPAYRPSMKPFLQLVPLILILGSCAPKAVLVEEAEKPAGPATAAKPDEDKADDGELPAFGHDDGLLDPRGLANMPTEQDMRSTTRETNSAIIVNPPEDETASGE